MRIVLLLGVVALALYLAARQFDWLSSNSANNIGQDTATLTANGSGGRCGIVADVRSASGFKGGGLVADLGRPDPIETLQVVVPQADLDRFDPSPAYWEGKRICVTGPVTSYRGRPEIVAADPNQIRFSPN